MYGGELLTAGEQAYQGWGSARPTVYRGDLGEDGGSGVQ